MLPTMVGLGNSTKTTNNSAQGLASILRQATAPTAREFSAAIEMAFGQFVESTGGSALEYLEPTHEDCELIEGLQSLGYLDGETAPSN